MCGGRQPRSSARYRVSTAHPRAQLQALLSQGRLGLPGQLPRWAGDGLGHRPVLQTLLCWPASPLAGACCFPGEQRQCSPRPALSPLPLHFPSSHSFLPDISAWPSFPWQQYYGIPSIVPGGKDFNSGVSQNSRKTTVTLISK